MKIELAFESFYLRRSLPPLAGVCLCERERLGAEVAALETGNSQNSAFGG